MFLIKAYCFSLIVTLVFSRSVTRIDDDQDTYSNIHKINDPPVVFEEFDEIIELTSLTTEASKAPLKEKLSFMDMVVLLALWNKQREFNNYNNGPFADHKSVAPINAI